MPESIQYFKDVGFEMKFPLFFFIKIMPFNSFNFSQTNDRQTFACKFILLFMLKIINKIYFI